LNSLLGVGVLEPQPGHCGEPITDFQSSQAQTPSLKGKKKKASIDLVASMLLQLRPVYSISAGTDLSTPALGEEAARVGDAFQIVPTISLESTTQ
jgi:hypothetical protein